VRRLGLAVAALAVALATMLTPALAHAQEFVKVEGAPRQEMPAGPFVAAAYAFIWIAVLAYVIVLARGLARVRKETGELRAKLDREAPPDRPRAAS
jgi:CcmD family protein